MAQVPGSYVLISLTIDDSSGTRELKVGYTMMAFMQNDTTPVISTYPAQGDIVLPNGSNRPFALVIRSDAMFGDRGRGNRARLWGKTSAWIYGSDKQWRRRNLLHRC